jgi:hypothetical protein
MALLKFRKADPFRVRSTQRDRETDSVRQTRLCGVLDDFRTEIAREHEGLRARYESVAARAAFSQQALEGDLADTAMASTVDDITQTMIHYQARLKVLAQQTAFVTALREEAEHFPLANEATGGREPFAVDERYNPRS